MSLLRSISGPILAASLFAPGALAQAIAQQRLLTVTGEGEVKAKPDQATLSAGVVSEGNTAEAALASNRRAMHAVFDALKRLGVPDNSIRTSEISIQPQYPNDARAPRRVTSYQVSNTVTVIVDALEKVGPALDALVAAGANSVGDIAFGLRDPKPLEAQARREAVRDALRKAEGIAGAAGIALGPIVAINEGEANQPAPLMRMAAPMAVRSTPVAAGEESISATVTISWEIR